jgi:hypothetical protein
MTNKLRRALKRGTEVAPDIAAYALYTVVAGTVWAGETLTEKGWNPWKRE